MLNLQLNAHNGNLKKLLISWKKHFDTNETEIEFLLSKDNNSLKISKGDYGLFLDKADYLQNMLKTNTLIMLPIVFYQYEKEKIKIAHFAVFEKKIKGFTREQAAALHGVPSLPDTNQSFEFFSGEFLLNTWGFSK